ncbi:protein GRINL1A [Pyxicephalus adspersus]|uniref:protein GRINL1A n=1 Tax=Pyxicephalus adspersus TaxID=30357 RepID=UPI003B5B81E5
MAAPVHGGKAGTVGDIHGKSIEELKEILERQEKLVNNKTFIARLPDRGKKILDYTEKVRAAIAEQERLNKTANLLSKFKLEFAEKQKKIKERTLTALPVDKKTLALPAETLENESSTILKTQDKANTNAVSLAQNSSSLQEKDEHKVDTAIVPVLTDIVSEMTSKTIVDAGSPPVQGEKNQQTAKNHADDLVDRMKEISIKDTERGSYGAETSNQAENLSHPSTKRSHYIEVIENRMRNPVHLKEKFKTNRLPSDSNSSSSNQSPGERALRLSAEERRAQDRKHLDDITAAKLPPLHHSPALLLPLEESLTLQIQQKKSYEETQAMLSAKRLFEKLNIKMGPYNPEGDSYMKYRDQRNQGYDAEE